MDWPSCPTTFAPIVGGRFYINISAFRRLADLTPGTSPDDIDRTLFAAGGIKLDPYRCPTRRIRGTRPADRRDHHRLPREPADRSMASSTPRRRTAGTTRGAPSGPQLGRVARPDHVVHQLNENDFVTPVHRVIREPGRPRVVAGRPGRRLRRRGNDLGRQAVMGIGGIESADAGRAVASLAGLEGAELEAAFQRVLEQYGFRGVNEWEIAAPSWEIRPDVLRRAVDAVRAGGAERDPDSARRAGWRSSRPTASVTRSPSSICGSSAARSGWASASARRRRAC